MKPQRDENGKLPAFAWPGGYPIYYLDGENSVLCPTCANDSDSENEIPQFRPVAADINWEDSSLYCDHCNQRIESAFGEQQGGAE
jgi:hypothetical protein